MVSKIWQYFKRLKNIPPNHTNRLFGNGNRKKVFVKCNLCGHCMVYRFNTTISMLRHLRSKHKGEVRRRESDAAALSRHVSTDESEVDMEDESTEEEETQHENEEEEDFMKCVEDKTPYPDDSEKKRELDKGLIKMICELMESFSLYTSRPFQSVIALADPRYRIPTKKDVTAMMLDEYHKLQQHWMEELSNVPYVAVSISWLIRAKRDMLLDVWCHFVDRDYQLKSVFLDVRQTCIYYEYTTAEDIAWCLDQIFTAWGIRSKIVCACADHGPVFAAALRQLNIEHVPCFASTLNTVVQNAIHSTKRLNEIIEKVRNIVASTKDDQLWREMLRDARRNSDRPVKGLQREAGTWWISSFQMIQSFVEMKEPLIHIQLMCGSSTALSPGDWKALEQCLKVLQPFYKAILEVSLDKGVAVSKVMPLTGVLRSEVAKFVEEYAELDKDGERQVAWTFASKLDENFDRFFNGIESNSIFPFATLLDPQFKKKHFANEAKGHAAIKLLMRECLSLIGCDDDDKVLQLLRENSEPSSPSSPRDFWSEFNKSLKVDPIVKTIMEVDSYLLMLNAPKESSAVTSFWSTGCKEFPTLSKLVKKFLCCPATCMPPEQIVSPDRVMLNLSWSRLDEVKLRLCLMLNRNRKCD